MGLVLAFQTATRPASSRQPQQSQRQSDNSRSAEILFFSGVRYERPSDVSAPGSAPATGGQPRIS